MMGKTLRAALVAAMFLATALFARAADVEFKFEIPPLPYPPDIQDVKNSAGVAGAGSFIVSAKIVGATQKKGACKVGGQVVEDPDAYTECDELTAWSQIDHPDISPNPPTIKKVNLYYYYNGDTATIQAPVSMTYSSETDLWTGNVTYPGTMIEGETISYFLMALDHYGNVSSWIPDASKAPCIPGTGSWDASLSTPVWSSTNCTSQLITQYEQCGEVVNGTPASCSTSYSMNDRIGDGCAEPAAGGGQSLLNPQVNKVDVHGISAGADGTTFCIRVGLGEAPPSSSDSPPIEGYLAIFFNPDVPDSNPGDTNIKNAYAITYAPEAQASDPTLVRVLWNGDCVTNPDTADPLGCKIKSAVPGDTDLSMAYSNGALVFTTKKSWSTQWGAVSLIGTTKKLAQIVALTGEINLSGDNLFWLVDLTNGLGFYHTSSTVALGPPGAPSAPLNQSATCKVGGSGTTSVCPKSAVKPTNNVCEIKFIDSLDKGFTDKYRIYKASADNVINDANRATYLLTELTIETDGSYSYSDTIAQADLNGLTRYYVLTAVNYDEGTASDLETEINDAVKTTCAPEDWVEPVAPTIASASTPAGNTKKCKVVWTADTEADSSITGFYVLRGDAPLFDVPIGAVAGMSHTEMEYTYTDTSADLTNGTPYTYKVIAEDRGANKSTAASTSCTPEDFESPEKISTLLVTLQSGVLGVNMDWDDNSETDLDGYDVYACKCDSSLGDNADCLSKDGSNGGRGFTKMNSSKLALSQHADTTSFSGGEGTYCFYAEALDDCSSAGTCPSNSGTPNSSGFPSGGCLNCQGSTYMKALSVTTVIDTCYPSFPDTGQMTATVDAAGGSCKLEWEKVCTNANPNGTTCLASFDCAPPDPAEIVAYEIIKQQANAASIPYPNTAEGKQGKVGQVMVNSEHNLTVSGLTNGIQYCFLPFSVDGSGNYPPADGQPNGVCCTPADTTDPSTPAMGTLTKDADAPWCKPTWTPVTDKDTLKYNLYRCDGAATTCTSATNFTLVAGAGDMAASTTVFEDGSVDLDNSTVYTYAITAEDPAPNESAIYTGGVTTNLKECNLTATAPITILGPTGAKIAALPDGKGCKFWWTGNAPDDTGSYTTGVGYNVYMCTSSSATSCQTSAINTSVLQDQYSSTLDAYERPGISANYAGTWYAGITFHNGALESEKTMTSDTCVVTSDCSDCIDVTLSTPVKEIDWETYDSTAKEWTTAAKSGVTIQIVDQSDGTVIDEGTTNAEGIVTLSVSEAAVTGKTLRVQAYFDTESFTGMLCDNTDFATAGCKLYMKSDVDADNVIAAAAGGYEVSATLKVPKPGGGRKEIGNAVCDAKVDFNDFKELKTAYKTADGDTKYADYADFNGDGKVDFNDFKILKANYKKNVAGAATLNTADAEYCKQ